MQNFINNSWARIKASSLLWVFVIVFMQVIMVLQYQTSTLFEPWPSSFGVSSIIFRNLGGRLIIIITTVITNFIIDDKDMSTMHTTMLRERGRGDQRGCPNRDRGPKLIRFESIRWRPKSNSGSSRVPGSVCHKTGHTGASGLRFRQSMYGWKS